MRDNWLSNRVFTDYEQIVALCEAWKKARTATKENLAVC